MTEPAGAEPPDDLPTNDRPHNPVSVFRFTTEGRAAPALFVIGWLGTVVGLLGLAIGILGPAGLAGRATFVIGATAVTIGLCGLGGSQAIERRAAALPGYTGPSPFLVFVAWLPATYVAWVLVGLPLELAGLQLGRLATQLAFIALQSVIAIGLVGLLVVGPGALSWREIGFNRPPAGAVADLAWGALLAGPAILATAVLATILVKLVGVAPESPLPPTGTPTGLAVHVLAGAIIAPIAEETIFRGVAIAAWRPSIGVQAAIIRSSVLFAAAHVLFVGGDSLQAALATAGVGFLGRLPVALFLGWAFVRRGSIWAPLGLHVVYNAVLIVAAELLVRSG